MNEMPKKPEPAARPYEKPDIVWEEDYTPTAFGVSCAQQPGNPSCIAGPVSG